MFITLTFDSRKFTAERAWAALKFIHSGGMDNIYNVIKGFDTNISKIFGTNGELVLKQVLANGYLARIP